MGIVGGRDEYDWLMAYARASSFVATLAWARGANTCQAAKLRQSLTDVSVEDIKIEEGSGAQIVGHIEPEREEMPPRIDDPARSMAHHPLNGEEGVHDKGAGSGRRGKGPDSNALLPVEEGDGGDGDCSPSSAGPDARADYFKSDDSGKLVLRPVARRPLKEMLRLDATVEVEGMEPVVRLEHLQPFMEKWAPEALTPLILSQVGDPNAVRRLCVRTTAWELDADGRMASSLVPCPCYLIAYGVQSIYSCSSSQNEIDP